MVEETDERTWPGVRKGERRGTIVCDHPENIHPAPSYVRGLHGWLGAKLSLVVRSGSQEVLQTVLFLAGLRGKNIAEQRLGNQMLQVSRRHCVRLLERNQFLSVEEGVCS